MWLSYWQKRPIRILVALLVLTGVIFIQYRLANIPLPVDVEKSTPKYTPVSAALIKNEELVVDYPAPQTSATPSPEVSTPLLIDNGKDFITADAYFESAHLRENTSKMLRSDPDETEFPTEDLTQIAYSTEGEKQAPANEERKRTNENAEPCRTSIFVEVAKGAKMPTELRFFQRNSPADRFRYFEMVSIGSDLIVRLTTSNRTGDDAAPGCDKTLVVGTWSRPLIGPVPIEIVVPAGKKLRFSFAPFADGSKLPETNGFEPFILGASRLGAQAVRKIAAGSTSSAPPVFTATAVEGGTPILLKHLLVGSDELQLDFSALAMVQENGKSAVTFDLWQFAKKYTLLAGLLAMLDAALLGWISRVVFGSKRREPKPKITRSRGKKKPKSLPDNQG